MDKRLQKTHLSLKSPVMNFLLKTTMLLLKTPSVRKIKADTLFFFFLILYFTSMYNVHLKIYNSSINNMFTHKNSTEKQSKTIRQSSPRQNLVMMSILTIPLTEYPFLLSPLTQIDLAFQLIWMERLI